MTQKDREILRELAKVQLELADSNMNREKISLWKRHNAMKGERPVIHIEIGGYRHEVIDSRMRCEDADARALELSLLCQFSNAELFGDDMPVPDYFPVGLSYDFRLFGHVIGRDTAADSTGREVGHKFNHIVTDLHNDFEKLMQPSVLLIDREGPEAVKKLAEDTFGDILPIRYSGWCLGSSPTQKVVHWMGLETMLISMYDYPEEFHLMMEKIAADTISCFDELAEKGMLLPTTAFEGVGQGSRCFTDELKSGSPVTSHDLWGYMDSQETVCVSPEMYGEFIFPYYERIASQFGLLSYGCCEAVHPIWDYLKNLKNLRKISISAWCDEDYMAEQLRGQSIIYHRKPSANFLGLGEKLDEDAFRAYIEKTVRTAHGCHLEITQRDLYTINNDIGKVRRYVEIIRESIERYWKP